MTSKKYLTRLTGAFFMSELSSLLPPFHPLEKPLINHRTQLQTLGYILLTDSFWHLIPIMTLFI